MSSVIKRILINKTKFKSYKMSLITLIKGSSKVKRGLSDLTAEEFHGEPVISC